MIFNEEYWQLIVNIINRNLTKLQASKANPIKATCLKEVHRFYATILRLESTYGNNKRNIKIHLNQIFKQFGSIKKLGTRRILQLCSVFEPSIEEISQLTNILNKNTIK